MAGRKKQGGLAKGRTVAPVKSGGLEALEKDVKALIDGARGQVAQVVNAAITTLYWTIGTRVRTEVLKEKRAEYGAEVVAELGRRLTATHGRGFDEKSLRRMLQFAEAFPDPEIVAALRRQLGWTHFKALVPIQDPLKRDFYAEMCRVERWSTRTLQQKIAGLLYERTALSKKPAELIRQELDGLRERDEVTPALVFKDPYVLDFLGLADTYSEKDLESALLHAIERFMLELGDGFAFVSRQKRLTLDGVDYVMDLLFFHRRLRRLVVIELKLGDFEPADAGQVALYLRWLDRHERQPGEERPIGLILCAGARRQTVEYLDLEPEGIHVAEYLTGLPSTELLREKFREALEAARARFTG